MALAFVIHEHSGCGPTHYDLMLEDGPVLATWQIPVCPFPIGQEGGVSATKLPDHRKRYLDYQGPISRGRGEVRLVEKGTYEVLAREEGLWRVKLSGSVMRGSFELAKEGETAWRLRRL
jgi:hypothetical protein